MNQIRTLIQSALSRRPDELSALHAEHINPTFIEALGLLGYGRDFVRGEGHYLWDAKGNRYLDFLSGYGSVPLGHNHPELLEAIDEATKAKTPNFLQIAPQVLAVALAQRLARMAPGDLSISYFMSSGSEAVEGALKLARAATGRPRFVFAEKGYHGTTLGALSVTGGKRARAPFEPLLPGCAEVPWGSADAIEAQLRKRDVAAVILEPMQAEGGMRPPPQGYLKEVSKLCQRYGSVFILDEIQTGLGRTGRMFACEDEGVIPDVLVLGKGLSGGLIPISSYTTTKRLWKKAYDSLDRYDAHCSTYTGGTLACAAALATLEILERDRICARVKSLGEVLGQNLKNAAATHPLVKEIRGRGFLWGIEFRAPGGAEGVGADLIGGWTSLGLLERNIIAQVAGHAPSVLRAEPPLTIGESEIVSFANALKDMLASHAPDVVSSLTNSVAKIVKTRIGRVLGGRV